MSTTSISMVNMNSNKMKMKKNKEAMWQAVCIQYESNDGMEQMLILICIENL